MNTLEMHKCECGNNADNYEQGETLIAGYPPKCSECAHAEECETPKNIDFYSAWFTGEGRAKCTKCNFVSAYWECACDLSHSCKDYPRNN